MPDVQSIKFLLSEVAETDLHRAQKAIVKTKGDLDEKRAKNAAEQKKHQDKVNLQALKFVQKLQQMNPQRAQALLRDILTYSLILGLWNQLNMEDTWESEGEDSGEDENSDMAEAV